MSAIDGVETRASVAAESVTAEPVTAESFAPFGRVLPMSNGPHEALVLTAGDGWDDAYTRSPITREVPSLGMTSAPAAPYASTFMERHVNIEEALLPAGHPIVLAVASTGEGEAPRAEDVRAFVIEPGTAVVLHPGVWHDACRGLGEPTSYYWLASCVDAGSSPWTPIVGGPVAVGVPA
ncbi:ureidoglycolate lyase [Leucobacter albus]|uniref:Ureidoglycolate lyase n=1 Tax=Leucobacter albus TaxID=272210 RepID=A0ABW3TUH3_9MICO